MASNYLDLQRLVFEEFFKISPSLLSRYASITDQLLYLILIPHILIVITLIVFANSIVKKNHSSIQKLIMITGYIWIVISGFYSTIAAIASVWFAVLLPAVFFLYIFFFFVPWSKFVKGVLAGKVVIARPFSTIKELERFYDELEHLNGIINVEVKSLTGMEIEEIKRNKRYKGDLLNYVRMAAERYKEKYGEDALKEWEKDMRGYIRARDDIIRKIKSIEER